MQLSLMVMNTVMTILKHQKLLRRRVEAVDKPQHVIVLDLDILVSMDNQDRALHDQFTGIQPERVHDPPAGLVVSATHGLHLSECAGILREALSQRRAAAVVAAGRDPIIVGRNVHSYGTSFAVAPDTDRHRLALVFKDIADRRLVDTDKFLAQVVAVRHAGDPLPRAIQHQRGQATLGKRLRGTVTGVGPALQPTEDHYGAAVAGLVRPDEPPGQVTVRMRDPHTAVAL